MKPLNLIALLLFLGGALWALTRSDRVVRGIQASYYSAISPFLSNLIFRGVRTVRAGFY